MYSTRAHTVLSITPDRDASDLFVVVMRLGQRLWQVRNITTFGRMTVVSYCDSLACVVEIFHKLLPLLSNHVGQRQFGAFSVVEGIVTNGATFRAYGLQEQDEMRRRQPWLVEKLLRRVHDPKMADLLSPTWMQDEWMKACMDKYGHVRPYNSRPEQGQQQWPAWSRDGLLERHVRRLLRVTPRRESLCTWRAMSSGSTQGNTTSCILRLGPETTSGVFGARGAITGT